MMSFWEECARSPVLWLGKILTVLVSAWALFSTAVGTVWFICLVSAHRIDHMIFSNIYADIALWIGLIVGVLFVALTMSYARYADVAKHKGPMKFAWNYLLATMVTVCLSAMFSTVAIFDGLELVGTDMTCGSWALTIVIAFAVAVFVTFFTDYFANKFTNAIEDGKVLKIQEKAAAAAQAVASAALQMASVRSRIFGILATQMQKAGISVDQSKVEAVVDLYINKTYPELVAEVKAEEAQKSTAKDEAAKEAVTVDESDVLNSLMKLL